MVTSGAIARGMRLLDLPVRPRAMDELQAGSAVGQATSSTPTRPGLARWDESRAGSAHPSDVAERTHYLNAREALGGCSTGGWCR